MSEPKFTPGPWTYIPRDEDGRTPLVCDADGDPLAECWMTLKIDEQNANAALIAAAPEMYDWLNWLIEMDMTVVGPGDKEKIKKILNKARGES